MLEKIEENPAAIVEQYRNVISRLETAADDLARAEWQGVAMRMRSRWRDWQVEDSLHEMAFGEPSE
jgi:hypothetical protein